MTTLTRQVIASSDDCRVNEAGTVHPPWDTMDALDAASQLLGFNPTNSLYYGAGLRFQNVTVPAGAHIVSAKLSFTAYGTDSATTVNIIITGEDADNPDTFSIIADYNARIRTIKSVQWNNVEAWTVDLEYDSPSIIYIIQEIIRRPGWTSGNAIVFFVEDAQNSTNRRRFYSWDASSVKAAKLTIEYEEQTSLPVTIANTPSANAVGAVSQRKIFYANTKWWAFFSDGTNTLCYYSADGITWYESPQSPIRAGVAGSRFSVHFDGTYFHYVWTSEFELNQPVTYRRGIPNTDGTITWSAAEQIVLAADPSWAYGMVTISVDSARYPFISYTRGDGYFTNTTPWITKSSTDNGTWATDSGFPYQLSTTTKSFPNYWATIVITLTNQRMLVAYANTNDVIRALKWTGSGWGTEDSTTNTVDVASFFNMVAEEDNAHFVFQKYQNDDLYYVPWTYSTDSFGTEEVIQALTDVDAPPRLTRNPANNNIFCFWLSAPTANHAYYKKRTTVWDTDPTDWIDETIDTFTGTNRIVSLELVGNNSIALLYETKVSAPYKIRFHLSILATPKSFSDVGAGVESFGIPFKAIPFNDVGGGAESFITPFRTMGFSEIGGGVDAFATPFRAMSFSDIGSGLDAFIKEILGAISKAFADSGYGSDAFIIPYRSMGFSDVGQGIEAFVIPFKALGFLDSGHGDDIFAIVFKEMGFVDIGSGSDTFIIPFKVFRFSDSVIGADAFIVLVYGVLYVPFSITVESFDQIQVSEEEFTQIKIEEEERP